MEVSEIRKDILQCEFIEEENVTVNEVGNRIKVEGYFGRISSINEICEILPDYLSCIDKPGQFFIKEGFTDNGLKEYFYVTVE